MLAMREAALAAGEREQRFEQASVIVGVGEQPLAGRPQLLGRGVRVRERDLEQRSPNGESVSELVRRVGDEPALRLDRRLASCE